MEAEGTNGSSLATCVMLVCGRERDETTEPVRLCAVHLVGEVVVGELPDGAADADTLVLMPGSRGTLLEGENGS